MMQVGRKADAVDESDETRPFRTGQSVAVQLDDRRERVQSVRRAFAVLQALASGPVPCSTQMVAERVNLDRTVVRRLLRTLEGDGLVWCRKQRWQLGPAAVTLGNAYLDGHPLYHTVVHHAMVLHDDIVASGRPWVVNAAVPVGADAVVVARFFSRTAPVDSVLKAGTRLPMTGSALGRSMLAFVDADRRASIVGSHDAAQLADRSAAIRARGGLETAVDEIRRGISAVAVPVRGGGGEPIAALAVSGPTRRLPLAPDSDLAARLRRAAARIAEDAPAILPEWPPREPAQRVRSAQSA